MTATVIEMVEPLAKKDVMTRRVLRRKDGNIFHDSTWVARVDYKEIFHVQTLHKREMNNMLKSQSKKNSRIGLSQINAVK